MSCRDDARVGSGGDHPPAELARPKICRQYRRVQPNCGAPNLERAWACIGDSLQLEVIHKMDRKLLTRRSAHQPATHPIYLCASDGCNGLI